MVGMANSLGVRKNLKRGGVFGRRDTGCYATLLDQMPQWPTSTFCANLVSVCDTGPTAAIACGDDTPAAIRRSPAGKPPPAAGEWKSRIGLAISGMGKSVSAKRCFARSTRTRWISRSTVRPEQLAEASLQPPPRKLNAVHHVGHADILRGMVADEGRRGRDVRVGHGHDVARLAGDYVHGRDVDRLPRRLTAATSTGPTAWPPDSRPARPD